MHNLSVKYSQELITYGKPGIERMMILLIRIL